MRKGQYLERLAKRQLEDEGFYVIQALQNTRLVYSKSDFSRVFYASKRQDLFGCDLIALKKDSLPRFIQVTADTGVKKRIEEWKKYPFPLPLISVELWQAKKEGGRWKFKIGQYDGQTIIWRE